MTLRIPCKRLRMCLVIPPPKYRTKVVEPGERSRETEADWRKRDVENRSRCGKDSWSVVRELSEEWANVGESTNLPSSPK